jgi:hypothetical protein
MGFFTSKKIFGTAEEIRKKLYKIQSLDYKERPVVYQALIKELDDNGVTAEELKLVIRQLKEDHEISEIDRKNLLALLNQ